MIQDCLASAQQCCPIDSVTPYLPTRLIDLGDNSKTAPRVVLSQNLRETGSSSGVKYAALSYCWGPKSISDQNLKTTWTSLVEHQKAIPVQQQQQVLKDTFEVCKALSIRYMWIDSLCIIQDDDDDFDAECSDMAKIYQGAAVTICSLSAPTHLDRFLVRNPKQVKVPFTSSVNSAVSGDYTLTYRGSLATEKFRWMDGIIHHELLELDLKLSEWDQRAWTFQEDQMTSRLLHFGNSRIHFRCRHFIWSENLSSEAPTTDGGLPGRVSVYAENPQTPEDKIGLYDSWYTVCSDYNWRHFTHSEDKLHAMAGLARYFAEKIQDRYIAGLWENDLARGLMWHMSRPSENWTQLLQKLSQPNLANIPSWSWLVHYSEFEHGTTVTSFESQHEAIAEYAICSIDVNFGGKNEFQRIKSAALSISARVLQVPGRFELSQNQGFISKTWDWVYEKDRIYHCDLDWVDEADVIHPPNGLMMMKVATSRGISDDQPVVWGLFLMPTSNPLEYRRVGIFSSNCEMEREVDPFKDVEMQQIRLV